MAEVIFAQQTVENFIDLSDSGSAGVYGSSLTGQFQLVEGKSYAIYWDGLTGTVECKATDNGVLYLGNLGLQGGTDTGEPMLIAYMPDGNLNVFYCNTSEESHVVGITLAETGAIIAEQEYTFGLTSSYCITESLISTPLQDGEQYTVKVDGVEYVLTATYLEGVTFVGNPAIAGMGEVTGEPFLIGTQYIEEDNLYVATMVVTDISTTTHTVGVYLASATEEEPDTSASIILKNYSGVDVQYDDVNAVIFDTPDGGQTIYSRGEAIEGVNVELNLASGDQVVKAPDGMLVKSAIIKKPENLVPAHIKKDIEIAGVVGTLAVTGAEVKKTVDLDFKDYITIDDDEKMAEILANYDNAGLHILFTGEDGTYSNGQFYKVCTEYDSFDPNTCPSSANEVTSDTALTSTIECEIGDLIIAAFVIRSPLVSLSDGWTLISTSKNSTDINSTTTTQQTLSFAYKYATMTNESITVTQTTSARIYINMAAFNNAIGFVDHGYQYQDNSVENDDIITVTRPTESIIVWGVASIYWGSGVWRVSNESKVIQSNVSTAPRLLMAIDTSDDDSVTIDKTTAAPNTMDVIVCGTLSIQLAEELHFTAVTYEDVPTCDIQNIVPDDGEVLTKVEIQKPETLVPENIVEDVNIGGIVGTAKTGGVIFDDTTKGLYLAMNEDGTELVVGKIDFDAIPTHTSENGYVLALPETISGYILRYNSEG